MGLPRSGRLVRGPSLEHYRCLKCYNPDTYSKVDTDTVDLIPASTPILVYFDVNAITKAVSDIVHILQNPAKNNMLTVLKGDSIKIAFKQVATILKNDKSTSIPEISPQYSVQELPTKLIPETPTANAKEVQTLPRVQTPPKIYQSPGKQPTNNYMNLTTDLPRVQPI